MSTGAQANTQRMEMREGNPLRVVGADPTRESICFPVACVAWTLAQNRRPRVANRARCSDMLTPAHSPPVRLGDVNAVDLKRNDRLLMVAVLEPNEHRLAQV